MKTGAPQISPTFKEIRDILKEVSISQKDTDRQMKESRQEMDKLNKETKEEMKKMFLALQKTEAHFNTQWGKLVESLVEGKLIELLQSRGVHVDETYTRVQKSYTDEKGELQRREIDIIAGNGREVVAVEVKTTLKPEDVKYFLETLKIFRLYFSRYKNATLYGAVAFLRSDAKAPLFAERQGLFVIRATGDSASLTNKPGFKPKAF
ncbi:MAG: hypothetical protein OXB86_06400 [Bdellovibrionales bacterium]|nr:hypothetical protein [Bdellovibrionales bacterium]